MLLGKVIHGGVELILLNRVYRIIVKWCEPCCVLFWRFTCSSPWVCDWLGRNYLCFFNPSLANLELLFFSRRFQSETSPSVLFWVLRNLITFWKDETFLFFVRLLKFRITLWKRLQFVSHHWFLWTWLLLHELLLSASMSIFNGLFWWSLFLVIYVFWNVIGWHSERIQRLHNFQRLLIHGLRWHLAIRESWLSLLRQAEYEAPVITAFHLG